MTQEDLMLAVVKLQEDRQAYLFALDLVKEFLRAGFTTSAEVVIKKYEAHYPREAQP
jgi:hypothetical protein